VAGVNAQTGQMLDGMAHVEQSIEKLLATRVGSRPMREWVGNPGIKLLGENTTERTILVWLNTIWAVLELFEPRFKIKQFVVEDADRSGGVRFRMDGEHRPYAHLDWQQSQLYISIQDGTVVVQSA